MYETCQRRLRQLAAHKNHQLLQFQASDEHEVTKGLQEHIRNLRFARVLDVRPAGRSDERVAKSRKKFAFRYSLERPTSTK